MECQRDRKAKNIKGNTLRIGKAAAQEPPPPLNIRADGNNAGKYCVIHGAGSRASEECFSEINVKKQRARRHEKESGKADCGPKTDPG